MDCLCGCGELIIQKSKYYNTKFIKGHYVRTRLFSPNYKNGRYLDQINGYWFVYKPDHLFANNRGYYLEHRWIYEQYYNCILLPYVDIHHIDGNRQNNSIENLKPLYRSQHITHHKKGKISIRQNMSNRYCLLCGSKETYLRTRDKRPRWHIHNNGFICGLCYSRLD